MTSRGDVRVRLGQAWIPRRSGVRGQENLTAHPSTDFRALKADSILIFSGVLTIYVKYPWNLGSL